MANLKLQGHRVKTVTPSNTDNISFVGGQEGQVWPCVLYVGTGGSVRVLTEAGDDVTFVNVQDGTWFPVQVVRVFASGTDADNIVAIW
jgi:hypothetical protein